MFEPIRGGTRGGQAEFKWSDVSADKDREHYLGHSINAPTGRWQKNKDVHWYNRDAKLSEDERIVEVRRVKQLEADALAVALGFEPAPKESVMEKSSNGDPSREGTNEEALLRAHEKEEKRRRRTEKKEAKSAKMDRRARERGDDPRPHQRRVMRGRSRSQHSRSQSPRRRHRDAHDYARRLRQSPNRPSYYRREQDEHGSYERERERERGQRRSDSDSRRELPSRRR